MIKIQHKSKFLFSFNTWYKAPRVFLLSLFNMREFVEDSLMLQLLSLFHTYIFFWIIILSYLQSSPECTVCIFLFFVFVWYQSSHLFTSIFIRWVEHRNVTCVELHEATDGFITAKQTHTFMQHVSLCSFTYGHL